MKPEDVSAIVNAMREAKMGLPPPEYTANLRDFLRLMLEFLDCSEGTNSPEEFMQRMPEIQEDQLKMILLVIRSAPTVLRELLGAGAERAKQVLPSQTGRKRALTMDQRAQIVKKIGDLIVKGLPTGVAQQRAAQSYGVSVATVRRTWRERGRTPTTLPLADAVALIFRTWA